VLVGALAMGMAMGPVGLTSAHAAEPVPSDTTGIQATQNLTPFEGSYWYVPRAYLPAYLHQGDGKPVVRIPDQTLWHFTDSADGYLLGCSYRSIDGGASWSPSAIVGSIAPDNSVQFGFYGEILTVGSGSLVGSRGRQTFLMQVSTGPASGGVTHWAYMVRARPGSPQWTSLPGTNGDSIASVDTGCVSPSSATPASG
jgi:hypothetical protein